jgi:hypothetical protein
MSRNQITQQWINTRGRVSATDDGEGMQRGWDEMIRRVRKEREESAKEVAFDALTDNSKPLALSDIEQILNVAKEVYGG